MADPTHTGSAHDRARVGWGTPFKAGMMDLEVVNMAHSGASVRTYTNDGYFQAILDIIEQGDWLLCQFGHNEFGSYKRSDKVALPGNGHETLEIKNLEGEAETLLTFGGYLRKATVQAKAKGANILILSHTPEVKYSVSEVSPLPPSRYVAYAREFVHEMPGYYYIDHYAPITRHLRAIGQTRAAELYIDNRHMNKDGAQMAADMFVRALSNSGCPLKAHIKGSVSETPELSQATHKRTPSPETDGLEGAGNNGVPGPDADDRSDDELVEKRSPNPEESYVLHGDVWVPVNTPKRGLSDEIEPQLEVNEKRTPSPAPSPEETYVLHGDVWVPTSNSKRSIDGEEDPQADVIEKRAPGPEESYVLHGDVWVPVNNPKRSVQEEDASQQGVTEKRAAEEDWIPSPGPEIDGSKHRGHSKHARHVSRSRHIGHKKRALSQY
ncbi:putative Rhamnogalacturonan acetylesterase [Taphrina deformans PYCC 5710]|uniref:Rhamnogalacturonan acetylesterase n=1 Tax=Taphrina deformans (strain PYCC 5710 / ATCC 11124 / CBS 356.35 / IMI 108563 / JCM 9778 / NBRC 8474) TaxID=1097556 RepID=R4XGB0_TAPDE|nr:putative Rhamnogalacturonan acetylesterase [Taphrina deformans PYCC 5710]|eukprot:CCG83529.1 putative Rhamnogalacturonan acetylesterase [Taphrina deformans PYCC 5710]